MSAGIYIMTPVGLRPAATVPGPPGTGGGAGAVNSVNTRTGDVVLTKADVGLNNVDNTNDANKPISTATQTALNAKTNKVVNDTNLVSATEYAHNYTVVDDNTSTASWPNRWQWMFKPFGGVAKLVQWVNEYGEWRGIPAKTNTVGWRLFLKDSPTDPARTVNAWEICDDRTNRNVIAAVNDNGLTAKNINRRVETNPTGTAVPAGLPDGTLWIEYTP